MKRRQFLRAAAGALVGMAVARNGRAQHEGTQRPPNILWISCEDTSPHLGCYGDPEARTPNLDKLAAEGARYANAFSVAGVCAPSRSCLITGMYPTTLGTCHMRCNHVPPAPVKCFPECLRNAGYFCTNNVKTDYNFPPPPSAWGECSNKAHWRNRPDKNQPFFAVFNFTITHESRIATLLGDSGKDAELLPVGERHDPAKAQLPPYYPDTPLIRKHWANYYDLITIMDRQAGGVLDELEEDGFGDNTIVFFFGDHGAGIPRAKRWMYDSGLHVPFIVRWPGRVEADSVRDELVSFVDFAPTVLSAAGVQAPKHMQGRAFLGEQKASPREYIYAARDRMDERYDLIRAVRDKRFKYIRNYEPWRPYAQYQEYQETKPVMQEMRRVEAAGQLKDAEKLFFRPTKPIEEFYDTANDPHELNNLVDATEHRDALERLRAAMDDWLDATHDVGFVPEIELEAWLEPDSKRRDARPSQEYPLLEGDAGEASVFGKPLNKWVADSNTGDALKRLRVMASLGLAGAPATPVLTKALKDADSAVAYWGAKGLGCLATADPGIDAALTEALARPEPSVRLAAADALCKHGQTERAMEVVLDATHDENEFARLYAVQILEALPTTDERVIEALKASANDSSGYVKRIVTHALASV